MKTFTISMLLLLCAVAAINAQEYRGAEIGLRVSNQNDRETLLILGVREGATSGLDQAHEEYELPPAPPNEIFDARIISTPGVSQLGLGGVRDYRAPESSTQAFTVTYTIAWQAGEGSTDVLVSWVVPYEARITALSIDGEDQAGESEWRSQFAQGQATVRVTFNYAPLEFIATPASLTFDIENRYDSPSAEIQLVTKNDAAASWSVSSDASWLDITPGSGDGDAMLTVSVVNTDMPNDDYEAVIRVRSPVYPAQLDIPVSLSVAVDVEPTAAAASPELLGNYPNPFTEETAIHLQLGSAVNGDAALRVYDALGRMVADLSGQLKTVGDAQHVRFHAAGLPPGIYTCRLDCGDRTQTRSLVLLK